MSLRHNIELPVISKRRKKAEAALFRESLGFDEEEAFQQVMGQERLGELAQSWGRPVDTAIPIPTAGPTPAADPIYRPTRGEETRFETRAREFQQETSPYPAVSIGAETALARKETPFTRMPERNAALELLEWATRPFDAWAEFITGLVGLEVLLAEKLGIPRRYVDPLNLSSDVLIEALQDLESTPGKTFTELYERFRERPWYQQLGLSLATEAALPGLGAPKGLSTILDASVRVVVAGVRRSGRLAAMSRDLVGSALQRQVRQVVDDVVPKDAPKGAIDDAVEILADDVVREAPAAAREVVEVAPVARAVDEPIPAAAADEGVRRTDELVDQMRGRGEAAAPPPDVIDIPGQAPKVQTGKEVLGRPTGAGGLFRVRRGSKEAYVQNNTPDPPAPPDGGGRIPPGGVGPVAPLGPPEIPPLYDRVTAGRFPWESPERAALDLHASAILNEERRAQKIVQDGSKVLKALGLGRYIKGQWVPRPKDMDVLNEFFDALHHPSEVAAGTRRIPAGMDDVYRTIRAKTDWEEAAGLDFDPEMALIEDYFFRGWKPPEGAFIDQQGSLISNPAFRKPRKDATYQEMRDLGYEPLSWNPFEQWRIRRMSGVKFRQQTDLVDFLKGMGEDLIRPSKGPGSIPEGWRVPEVGKAFQGKPFAYLDEFGQQQSGSTDAWIVPDDVANLLENTYGKAPTLRKVTPFGISIDLMKWIDWLVFVPKRVKLTGSFFQPIDFLIRGGVGSWGASVNAIRTGHPVSAVQSVIGYPGTARDVIGAFFSPNWRKNLTQRLEDTTPIVRGRPGVNVKGISESGLNIMDPTLFARDPLGIDAVIREVVQETLKAKIYKTVPRALLELERVMRQGLFGGVYPAAIINDIQKNIAPQMIRTYGKTLNDAQLNRAIAQAANLRYSSLPATQSVVQNRALRHTLMRVSFSMNENEGLLRQATNTLPVGFRYTKSGGPKLTRGGHFSKFWLDHWLGAYAFLISTASVVHFASTGEHLPADRFNPISADKWGPLPFGYNTKFAAPTLSTDFARQLLGEAGDVLEGRPSLAKAGLEARADIVGQMDTAIKVLDPWAWVMSRLSVPVSAFSELEEAEDFYGTPTDEVGPGGIVSMTTHLLQTMFAPIGWGGAGINIAVQNNEILEPFLSMGEEKLGAAGHIVQALGLNLRAEGIDEALERMHPDFDTLRQSERERIRRDLIFAVYGPKTRRDSERIQEKVWELFPGTDTPQARAKFKADLDRKERQKEIRMRDQGPGGDEGSPGFLRDVISDIITNFPNPIGR